MWAPLNSLVYNVKFWLYFQIEVVFRLNLKYYTHTHTHNGTASLVKYFKEFSVCLYFSFVFVYLSIIFNFSLFGYLSNERKVKDTTRYCLCRLPKTTRQWSVLLLFSNHIWLACFLLFVVPKKNLTIIWTHS